MYTSYDALKCRSYLNISYYNKEITEHGNYEYGNKIGYCTNDDSTKFKLFSMFPTTIFYD